MCIRDSAGSLGGWLSEPLLRAVAGAVLDGNAISAEDTAAMLTECQDALAAMVNEVPAVYPLMSEHEAARTIREWTPPFNPARKGMLLAAERYLSGDTNTLWAGSVGGHPALFSAWLSGHKTLEELPALFLDATADEQIYRAIFGNAVEFIGLNIPMAAGVKVTQITDSTVYQRKTDPTRPRADHKAAQKMVNRLAAWAMLNGTESDPSGLISYAGTVAAVFERVPVGCVLTAHFGGLRGLNHLSGVQSLCVAGRIEPAILDAMAIARALWPNAADLQTSATDYKRVRSFYTLRDGRQVPCEVRSHTDPRIAACIRSIRDEELIQAIGRGRYIHSTGERELLVATSVPVPGLIVDRLATLDEALPEARLSVALLAGNGVALLSAKWLAETCPGEFPKIDSAKDWLRSFKGEFTGNSIFTRKSPFENENPLSLLGLHIVSYRVDGTRGGKAKRACMALDLSLIHI